MTSMISWRNTVEPRVSQLNDRVNQVGVTASSAGGVASKAAAMATSATTRAAAAARDAGTAIVNAGRAGEIAAESKSNIDTLRSDVEEVKNMSTESKNNTETLRSNVEDLRNHVRLVQTSVDRTGEGLSNALLAVEKRTNQVASEAAKGSPDISVAIKNLQDDMTAIKLSVLVQTCSDLGEQQGDLRIYTKDECDAMNGVYSSGGDCAKKEGGSFSYDCGKLYKGKEVVSKKSNSFFDMFSSTTPSTVPKAPTSGYFGNIPYNASSYGDFGDDDDGSKYERMRSDAFMVARKLGLRASEVDNVNATTGWSLPIGTRYSTSPVGKSMGTPAIYADGAFVNALVTGATPKAAALAAEDAADKRALVTGQGYTGMFTGKAVAGTTIAKPSTSGPVSIKSSVNSYGMPVIPKTSANTTAKIPALSTIAGISTMSAIDSYGMPVLPKKAAEALTFSIPSLTSGPRSSPSLTGGRKPRRMSRRKPAKRRAQSKRRK